MNRSIRLLISLFIVIVFSTFAEKIMVYDEEKGIIFVDKDAKSLKKSKTEKLKKKNVKSSILTETNSSNIYKRRKKDPPKVYFNSGLVYYKNEDYKSALKNFMHASEMDVNPLYLLWIAKCYRQLEKTEQFIDLMKRITTDHDQSDVADDALFEQAFYFQKKNNYNKATMLYKILAEQYPFARSYSSNEDFLELSRSQRKLMRDEMYSSINVLGIKGDILSELYTQFQKINQLPVTGEGDSLTVSSIKTQHSITREQNLQNQKINCILGASIKWLYFAALLILISFIVNLLILKTVKNNNEHISLLSEMLADLR